MNPKTCPLCGTTLIPRYEFKPIVIDNLTTGTQIREFFLKVCYICPDCIPPDPGADK